MTHSTPQGSGRPLLVGRSRERGLLHSQLREALAGKGGLVILSGEAGIGKTSLAEDACRNASDAGALVLAGNCYDRSETPPYGPWVEILEQASAPPSLSAALRAITAPGVTHGSSQTALFGEVREFLAGLSRVQPLVILLDDLHWADTASLDLLRFVARKLASIPILLLITYRSDEVGRQQPLYWLMPLLVREALAVRIDLSPLGDDDVRDLIHHVYQLTVDDTSRLATHLQARAEGNPFFLGELLRSLHGSVLLPMADDGWSLGPLADIRVPVMLRQVIDARLQRLGAEADALLAIAAVIGQVVPLALWTTAAATTTESLIPLIERAVEARVIDAASDGLTVRFAHALIREALYDGVLPPRRRVWHRQIAEMLVALDTDPDPDAVAWHFSQAGDVRAVLWLTRAGERACRALAWRTAARRFEAALAFLDHDAASNERGWLLFRLALLRRFVDPAAGVASLEESERLGQVTGDRALVAYARFYQGMLRCMRGDFRLGIAAEEAGIAMLDALSPADRDRLAALDTTSDRLDAQHGRGDLTLALGENGRYAQARALGERIISLPPEQTTGSRGDAYYGLGYTYAAFGQPEAARRAFSLARAMFRADDHRSMVTASLFDELLIVILPYQADQPLERQRVEAELTESFATLDDVFDERSVRSAKVVSRVLEGDWSEAFGIFEESSLRYTRLVIATLLAPIARHQANAALAWTLVRDGLPDGPRTAPEDSAGYILPLRTLAVTLALDAGDLDAARQWLDALGRWLDWSGSVLGRADAHLCWAGYYRAAGDVVQSRERAMQAFAAARAPHQPLVLLAAHRLLGELDLAAGRLDDAESQLAAALELADNCGARHERALTMLARAELLHRRGDQVAARGQLDSVRALCIPMGAALTLAQADALDMRVPSGPAASAPVLPAGLTVREAEVLRQLTTGLTNAEIARELGLSPRTIDAHLTTIYAKLGVTTRGAAIRFALDHDLR